MSNTVPRPPLFDTIEEMEAHFWAKSQELPPGPIGPPGLAEAYVGTTEPGGAEVGTVWFNPEAESEGVSLADLVAGMPALNLRTEGFLVDGVTDETVRFQALLDSSPTGTVIVLDENANLRVSAQVNIANKTIHFEFRGNAKITLTTKLTVPFLNISNAPGTVIRGMEIVGAEAAFDGVLDTQAYAVHLNNCADSRISSLTMRNISRGLMVMNSNRTRVDDLRFFGNATTHVTNINFHSGVVIRNSHDVNISRPYAEKCGHVVLVGWSSDRGSIVQAVGYNCFDNGIYISSGDGWEVVAPRIRADASYVGTIGTGCKMRGSQNVLLGGYFLNMGFGAIISGDGLDEGDGFSGRGSKIIGARAVGCKTGAFLIDDYGGFQPRNMTIAYCTVWGGGTGDGVVVAIAAMRIRGTGHRIESNIIDGWTFSACLRIDGTSTLIVSDIVMRDNIFRNTTVNAIYCLYGYNITAVDNTIDAVTNAYGMRFTSTEIIEVSRTRKVGTAGTIATIRIDATAPVSGVRVIDNPQSTVSGAASGLYSGNDPAVTQNISVAGAWAGNTAGKALTQVLAQLNIIRDQTTA